MEEHFVFTPSPCSVPFSPFLGAHTVMNAYPLSLSMYLFIYIHEYYVILFMIFLIYTNGSILYLPVLQFIFF